MQSDIHTSVTRLQKSATHLCQRWTAACEVWNDSVSREFDAEFVQPIMPQVRLALAAVRQMAEVLDNARRECEDRFFE